MRNEPYILGDPHLGRRFTKGIPVERRGQREQLMRDDLNRHLAAAEGHTVHITLGDLFDKPQVAYEDLAFAAVAYTNAALEHPGTTFYILQGNHDDSRDLAEVTAWDIFCRLMSAIPNVTPVTELTIGPDFILFPWDPVISAAEMVEKAAGFLAASDWKPTTAYGHFDVDPRSSGHNLIPTKELAELGITRAVTGHVHKPDTFRRDGVDVVVFGSMQPYAQGEDGGQGHIRYDTVTLDQLAAMAPDALSNSCVRLQLQPGEQAPDVIPDCMSWDVQRMRPVDEEVPADISMEGFDTTAAIKAALDEHEIIPEVRDKVDARLAEVFGRGE